MYLVNKAFRRLAVPPHKRMNIVQPAFLAVFPLFFSLPSSNSMDSPPNRLNPLAEHIEALQQALRSTFAVDTSPLAPLSLTLLPSTVFDPVSVARDRDCKRLGRPARPPTRTREPDPTPSTFDEPISSLSRTPFPHHLPLDSLSFRTSAPAAPPSAPPTTSLRRRRAVPPFLECSAIPKILDDTAPAPFFLRRLHRQFIVPGSSRSVHLFIELAGLSSSL